MLSTRFSINLRRLRHDYGLTQEELGEILNLAKSQISFYERGLSYPKADLVTRVAQYFNVPLTQLIETTIRPDFYLREVVTGENITIHLPTKDGVETLTGEPGFIKIPAQADLSDIGHPRRDLLKYANFMLLFPKEGERSAIASFFYEHFNELGRQKIENLFRLDEWVEDVEPTITYDGYPLLYQLFQVNNKGSWINSPLTKPATNVNVLALALPQNDAIIRLYIQPENSGCKLHAKRCQGLDELLVEWLQKSKEECQTIAREYCLQIMKAETEAEDWFEENYVNADAYDKQYNLRRFLKRRGIEQGVD
ncbi:helix-turn-helix transcriptional regulator [Negativicoccus succinicivorans]|uniref:helix-turn-helix domain-containing protein n=1 Tax=Negativicoccus succinicivorans TaxID=620903 RepID=UPI0028D8E1B1|nr:helix-turn-helix transcriptional regulator [Negativicoccus succinicivorans]